MNHQKNPNIKAKYVLIALAGIMLVCSDIAVTKGFEIRYLWYAVLLCLMAQVFNNEV